MVEPTSRRTFKDLVLDEMNRQGVDRRTLAKLTGLDRGNTWQFIHNPERKGCNVHTAIKIMRVLQIDYSKLSEVEL